MANKCLICGKGLKAIDKKNPYLEEVNMCLKCRVGKIDAKLKDARLGGLI